MELPPGFYSRLLRVLRDPSMLVRLGMCALAAVVCSVVTIAWRPPFEFRKFEIPDRGVASRVDFSIVNAVATEGAREMARQQSRLVFSHDPEPLVQLQARLKANVVELLQSENYQQKEAEIWETFLPAPTADQPVLSEQEKLVAYERFRDLLSEEGRLVQFEDQLAKAFAEFEQRGLFRGEQLNQALETMEGKGNQAEIFVYPRAEPNLRKPVRVNEARLAEAEQRLRSNLEEHLQSKELADRVFRWLVPRFVESGVTLTFDQTASLQVREQLVAEVEPRLTPFRKGDILAQPGVAIDEQNIALLQAEYQAHLASLSLFALGARLLATLGMYTAMFTLCGVFMRFRYPEVLSDQRRLASLIGLSAATVVLGYWTHAWSAEIIPLLLFAMTVTIAYNQEMALLCSAAVGLVIVFSIGQGMAEFVILMAATATAVLLLRRIRSRTKLIYVGLAVGMVTALTTVGVNLVENQALSYDYLLRDAGVFGLFGLLSGVAMSGLLPFVEEAFGVLTDLSLLELGDVAHPLLQELVRRAPGTYNHSINVASLGEAAAESIGARGLLVRVGAYF
ncbi:MAG: hypothetical protein WD030_02130, partial [Pirellulales bacterium]